MDRSTKEKISKETQSLKDTMDKLDLIDIYRTFHHKTMNFTFFSSAHGTLYAEYIMRNSGLEEAQAGIEIAGRNINNLIYADDTTLVAESEELKSLLVKAKEETENFGLKLNILKTKIMASGPFFMGNR